MKRIFGSGTLEKKIYTNCVLRVEKGRLAQKEMKDVDINALPLPLTVNI